MNSKCDAAQSVFESECYYSSGVSIYAPDENLSFIGNGGYEDRNAEWVASASSFTFFGVEGEVGPVAGGVWLNTIERFITDENGNEVGPVATANYLAQQAMADFESATS